MMELLHTIHPTLHIFPQLTY